MGYSAYVVKIEKIAPHPNADKLQIATVFGGDVITGLDVQPGWKMVYFPSDGQLSREFGDFANLLRKKDENGNNIGGYIDENKRNIKAIKLRGSKSDGILISAKIVADFAGVDIDQLKDGDTISVLNGKEIARKYIPKTKSVNNDPKNKSNKPVAKNVYPFFEQHKDTSQLRYSLNEFRHGDIITISLKLHGTSGRVSRTPKISNTKLGKIKSFFRRGIDWEVISGSRRVVLENFNGGYYGDNKFRQQYQDLLSEKLEKGETAYFEIVGYADIDKPIMSVGDNKKLKDKNFVKKYGKTTTFTYGCENGQSEMYVYRMTKTDEDGNTVEYPTWYAKIRCEQMGVKHVPLLSMFMLGEGHGIETHDDLLDFAKEFSEGSDLIDPTHIREGVIVRIENRSKFTAFKEKSFSFKILEGIIKEDAVEPDIEEAQDSIGESA